MGIKKPITERYDRIYSIDQLKSWAIDKYDLKNNSHVVHIDLGRSYPVFDWHFNNQQYIEWNHMKYLETKLLMFGSNYFGVFSYEAIKEGMFKLAKSITSRFVGLGVTELTILHNVNSAMKCIDTYELTANKTIRFIKNPYYTGEPININKELGGVKKENTSQLIREYLEDYDYNQEGIMRYNKISDALNISLITVKRYMKEDEELKEIYKAVKKSIILK
jgi:hypothetical protein